MKLREMSAWCPRFVQLVPGATLAATLALGCGGTTTNDDAGAPSSTCTSVRDQICAEAAMLVVSGDVCSSAQSAYNVQHFKTACQKMHQTCGSNAPLICDQ